MLVKELILKLQEECDQEEEVFICSDKGLKCNLIKFVHPEIALYTEDGDEIGGGVVLSHTEDLL